MKNVGFNKVQTMTDVNVELDKIRRLLTNVEGSSEITYDSTPIGCVTAYAGIKIPDGYLNCDGSAISRTTYAALYSALGTTWGIGDGSTTFNIPDLRSATLRGVGTPTLYTSNTAIALAQTVDDKMQGHIHRFNGVYGYAFKMGAGSLGTVTSSGSPGPSDLSSPYADAINGNPRYGLETTGKARGVYFIIKALNISTLATSTVVEQFAIKEYAYITMSADQTTGIADTNPIKFNLISGNMYLDAVNYRVTLKANKTYRMQVGILAGFSGNTGALSFNIYNVTDAAQVGTRGYCLTADSAAHTQPTSLAFYEITTTVDTIFDIRLSSPTVLSKIYKDYSFWEIQQIN